MVMKIRMKVIVIVVIVIMTDEDEDKDLEDSWHPLQIAKETYFSLVEIRAYFALFHRLLGFFISAR